MSTLEQKYEALKIIANSQIDTISLLVQHDAAAVGFAGRLSRARMNTYLDARPDLVPAWEEVSEELLNETVAELQAEVNAEKQGYPNA